MSTEEMEQRVMPEREVEAWGAVGGGGGGNIQQAEAMEMVFLRHYLQPLGRAPELKHTLQEGND